MRVAVSRTRGRSRGRSRRGEAVGFFPEGTFTRAPGIAPFHLGAFTVAAGTGTPVAPVVLSGTRSLLRAGRWLPERASVSVDVQPALTPEGHNWSLLPSAFAMPRMRSS